MARRSLVRRETPRPKAIIAAAARIQLDGTSWRGYRLGGQDWQREGWHQYDINGELRFVANWVGQACSRARLVIVEKDELGRPGKEVEDASIQTLAETVFGGPARKAEAQRLMGLHLYVPGESFIVAESVENANEDRWYVVSGESVRPHGTNRVQVERPVEYGGGWYELNEGRDLLIRVWTPHPRKPDAADSSVRPALIPLREIEQLTKYEFAQIDSRLAGAGVLFVPDEMDFPSDDEDDGSSANGLTQVIQRAMQASLRDRSDPASLVPIIVQVGGDYIGKLQHLTFDTGLNDKITEMKEGAMTRLARALDVDPEVLTGKGDTNHWSAWQIEESTIKMHIEPLLARMCDALTEGYLKAALGVMNIDADKYMFWYDVAPLTVQPDRQGNALELYREGIVSAAEVRVAGNFAEDSEPDPAEYERRLAREAIALDPALLREPDVQKALGITWKLSEPEPPALPPGADQLDQPDEPGGDGAANQQPPARQNTPPRGNGPTTQEAVLTVGSHLVVTRALELAGKRLLTREFRDKYQAVDPWELHSHIRVLSRDHAARLVGDAPFVGVPLLAASAEVDPGTLTDLLQTYCVELVHRGAPHSMDLLETYLSAGLHAECTPEGLCKAPHIPGNCQGRLLASAGVEFFATADDGVDWDDSEQVAAYLDEFHLRGRHNQKNHGRRVGRPGFQPFSPVEKRARQLLRDAGDNPDFPKRESKSGRDAAKSAITAREVQEGRKEAQRDIDSGVAKKVAEETAKRKAVKKAAPKKAAPPKKPPATKQAAARAAIDRKYLREALTETQSDIDGLESLPNPQYSQRDRLTRLRIRRDSIQSALRGEKPDAIGISTGGGNDWHRFILNDSEGPDDYVRVSYQKVHGHEVRNGMAYRVNGIVTLVDTGDSERPIRSSREKAYAIAQGFAAQQEANLPEGSFRAQNAYMVTDRASPDDKYWGQRFGTKHVSNATGGSGIVSFWGRRRATFTPGRYEGSTIRHEFGHNMDPNSSVSGSTRYAQAIEADRFTSATTGKRDETTLRPLWDVERGNFSVDGFVEAGYVSHRVDFISEPGRESPDGPTEYGKSSKAEDFAESMRLYLKGEQFGDGRINGSRFRRPVLFRDLFPGRAAILDELFPEIAKQQKRYVAGRGKD